MKFITDEIETCPNCSDITSFEFLNTKAKQGIDVKIPCGDGIPEISDCQLAYVDIPYFILRCNTCHEKLKVMPSFITKGTTLTLAAQAIVAMSYHQSNEKVWRKVQTDHCREDEGIAHSTLYRGYQVLGMNLEEAKSLLDEIHVKSAEPFEKIKRKAQKEHTSIRESMIIQMVYLLNSKAREKEELRKMWIILWKILELIEGCLPRDGVNKVRHNVVTNTS